MQEECLYEVKNKNYIWTRIGLIALIPWLYMSFKWLFVLQTKGSEALMEYMNYILGSLLLIPFVLIPIISKHKYSIIKFYADKLVVKGVFNFELNYNEIKTIYKQKKAIYILGKDYEEYNKEYYSLDSDNKYGTLIHKYSYNKIIVMPNTIEIYNKLIEIIGEKECEIKRDEITNSTQVFTHINKVPSKIFNCFFKVSCSFLGALFLFLIIASSITSIKEDFFYNMNKSIVIFFIIISSILLFFIIDKFTKRGNEDIRCYEIYKDYILGVRKKKTQIIKPINYKDVLKVQVSIAGTSVSPKDVNIAIWYLRPDSKSIERIVLREINEDNGQIIIDLIRKSKGIECKKEERI